MAHAHPIIDADRYFSIDPHSRTISYESDAKLALVQFDHNSERFTFGIPRHIEDHDMSVCNKVRIHYMNVGSAGRYSDVYEVADLHICEDDDSLVLCSWLISQKSTQYVGTLNFVVQYMCMTGDEIDYAWHTAAFTGIKILEGMNNAESIVEQYADALTSWFLRLEEAAITIDPTNAVNAVHAEKDAIMSEVYEAIEICDPAGAVAAVKSASDAIIANFDISVDRVYGELTLTVDSWKNSNVQTVSIPGLIDEHGIFFTPLTVTDKNNADLIGLHVTASVGKVTFYSDSIPNKDVNFSYLIFGIAPAEASTLPDGDEVSY